MKTILRSSVLLGMALAMIFVAPVQAQVGFDDWLGQWLKGNVTDKGFLVDSTGTYKLSTKTATYAYVQCLDESSGVKIYTAWLVQFDSQSRTWRDAVPYVFQVLNGTPLNYISYGFIPPETAPGVQLLAAILNIQGKEKNGALTQIKAKSVGACVVYDLGGGVYSAADEVIDMKGISADKVPVEVQAKILVLPPCAP